MSELQISATIKQLSNNTTLATLPFTFNEDLNCYVCEVDINNIGLPKSAEANITITMESEDIVTPVTYGMEDIYVFNTDTDYIIDRKMEDVERAQELISKWYTDSLTDAEKMEWQLGLKGTLNYADISRINTQTSKTLSWYIKKFDSFIHGSYYISQFSFLNTIAPDNMFMYSSGFQTMLTQFNQLFHWLNSEAYEDILLRAQNFLQRYIIYYGLEDGLIPNVIITMRDYEAWNDLEKYLYILFLAVIYYNITVMKTAAKDFTFDPAKLVSLPYDLYMTSVGELYTSFDILI